MWQKHIRIIFRPPYVRDRYMRVQKHSDSLQLPTCILIWEKDVWLKENVFSIINIELYKSVYICYKSSRKSKNEQGSQRVKTTLYQSSNLINPVCPIKNSHIGTGQNTFSKWVITGGNIPLYGLASLTIFWLWLFFNLVLDNKDYKERIATRLQLSKP